MMAPFMLGGCSSAMDYGSSLGESGIRRIGRIEPVRPAPRPIMSEEERQRLINELVREGRHHREEALREIEAR